MATSIDPTYAKVLNLLNREQYSNGIQANEGKEIEHFLFVVKSEYGMGQLSERLNVIKYNDLFLAVDKEGVVKFEVAMTNTFEIVKLTNEAYNQIEQSI